MRGTTRNPETVEPAVVEDQGYSFCNCKNIWYTDWKNIDIRIYDDLYHQKFQEPTTEVLFKSYAKRYFPEIRKLTTIGNFLDIGSINSTILDEARKEGWTTHRLDINPASTDDKHFIITGNIETPSVMAKLPQCTTIWMSHIIEHLKDPIAVLKGIYEHLEDTGVLFVAMPDPYFITWHKPYDWGHWHLREHHIMWDMDSFIEVMEELGYKCKYKYRNLHEGMICCRDYHLLFQK